MRDKGRAVLTAKDKERAILEAIGQYPAQCGTELNGQLCGERHNVPNLSDPGVFLSLFEPWVKEHGATYFYNSAFGLFGIVGDLYQLGKGESLTEAGINAWHAALTAMGKIREG